MKLFRRLAESLSWKRGITAATGVLRAGGEFRVGGGKKARLRAVGKMR
jgi:hypothetical protein